MLHVSGTTESTQSTAVVVGWRSSNTAYVKRIMSAVFQSLYGCQLISLSLENKLITTR